MRVGLLTSGGDSPGMNACIRAVVRGCLYYGMEIYGIHQGYEGLIHDEFEPMKTSSVADIIHRGGTILQTARSEEFMTDEGVLKAYERLRIHLLNFILTWRAGSNSTGRFPSAKRTRGSYGLCRWSVRAR